MIREKNSITSCNNGALANIIKKGKIALKKGAFIGTFVISLTGCTSFKNKTDYVQDYKATIINESTSNITAEDIAYLSNDVKTISLKECPYLTSLDALTEICPDIVKITIDDCPAITDYSFLYHLPKLKEVTISNSAFITRELVDYLDSRNIKHNIKPKDLINVKKIDDIVSNIITRDMDDYDKIQAITCYVMENYQTNILSSQSSNDNLLNNVVTKKKCTPKELSYLVCSLLLKADVNSYQIMSSNHTWNLVEVDDKYYYLDPANLKKIPGLSKFILKNFNVGYYYMSDPGDTQRSQMNDYTSNKIMIPKELVADIKKGELKKNFFELYTTGVKFRTFELLVTIISIFIGIDIASNKIKNITNKIKKRK